MKGISIPIFFNMLISFRVIFLMGLLVFHAESVWTGMRFGLLQIFTDVGRRKITFMAMALRECWIYSSIFTYVIYRYNYYDENLWSVGWLVSEVVCFLFGAKILKVKSLVRYIRRGRFSSPGHGVFRQPLCTAMGLWKPHVKEHCLAQLQTNVRPIDVEESALGCDFRRRENDLSTGTKGASESTLDYQIKCFILRSPRYLDRKLAIMC